MSRLCAAAPFVAILVLAGCGDQTLPDAPHYDVTEKTPDDRNGTTQEGDAVSVVNDTTTPVDVGAAVRDANAFAFDLYQRIRTGDGNIIFSPYSISTALAMTYAGARGETESQMAKTLHFALVQRRLHAAMSKMMGDLNARARTGVCDLVVANRLWGQTGQRFLPWFLTLTEKRYGAGMELVDFERDTERARQDINAWVERQTRKRIRNLLARGVLTPATRLVLTNAIYFKGAWSRPFLKRLTLEEPFRVTSSSTVRARMMRQTARFGYAESRGMQVLEMPYEGDNLAMVVVLPRAVGGLRKLEGSISAARLASWVSGLRAQKVEVILPRFTATRDLDLSTTLAAMGMPDAFDPNEADFSGMDGTGELYISKVIHKAFVEVNEEGTEAAAATAVVVAPTGLPPRHQKRPPVFRADRPFLYLIRDVNSGAILFIGRVTDPTA